MGSGYSLLQSAGYLVVPGAIMIVRQVLDLEDPGNVLMLRGAVAVVTAATTLVLLYLYVQVITSPDKARTVFVRPSQLVSQEFEALRDPNEPDDKKEMTYKEYDVVKLRDLAGKIAMTTMMTLLMHWWFDLTPVLIMTIFMQPRMIYGTPFWRIYVRRQSEKIYTELRRPWPEPKSGIASKWQKRYTEYVRKTFDPDATVLADAAAKKQGGKKARRQNAVK